MWSRLSGIGFVLIAMLSIVSPVAAESARHSGRVVAVPDAGTLVIDEMGPWTGLESRPTRRSIALGPDTVVTLAGRSTTTAGDGWPRGFTESAVKAAEIRPGDYVTVTAETSGARLVARSIVVVRPATE